MKQRLNIAGLGHGVSEAELRTLSNAGPVDMTGLCLTKVRTIGRCLHYEFENGELWATAEIDDDALDELASQTRTHCEAIITGMGTGTLRLHAVVVTTLPRGSLQQMIQGL